MDIVVDNHAQHFNMLNLEIQFPNFWVIKLQSIKQFGSQKKNKATYFAISISWWSKRLVNGIMFKLGENTL